MWRRGHQCRAISGRRLKARCRSGAPRRGACWWASKRVARTVCSWAAPARCSATMPAPGNPAAPRCASPTTSRDRPWKFRQMENGSSTGGSDRSLRLLDAATGAVRGSHSSGAAIAQVVTDAAGGLRAFRQHRISPAKPPRFLRGEDGLCGFSDHPFAPFPGSRATQRALARRHPVAQLPVFTSTMSCGALSRWAAGLTRM